MIIPKQLMEAAEQPAEKFADENEGAPGGLYSTEQVKSYEELAFKAGVEWLFSHFCELSAREFDRYAAEEIIESIAEDYPLGDYTVTGFDIDIARHQHTFAIASPLKARSEIAVHKESRENLEKWNDQLVDELKAAKQTIQKQKEYVGDKAEEIIAAKQEIARLKDESDHWRRAHKTLQDSANSRLKELEAALGIAANAIYDPGGYFNDAGQMDIVVRAIKGSER